MCWGNNSLFTVISTSETLHFETEDLILVHMILSCQKYNVFIISKVILNPSMNDRIVDGLVYIGFILAPFRRKLLLYRNTLESIPGTNQYWAMSVKYLAQGNNGLVLSGFEAMLLAIAILKIISINHSYCYNYYKIARMCVFFCFTKCVHHPFVYCAMFVYLFSQFFFGVNRNFHSMYTI